MAWYPGATRRELPQNKTQKKITPRSVVLHTAVSNSSDLYSYFSSGRTDVESHFYIDKNGNVLQYMDTTVMAHCQLDGNDYGVSIETWDGAGSVWDGNNVNKIPAWNAKQVAALTKLIDWICKTHNIPVRKCPAWDGKGIGYHAQFTGRPGWNTSHACPGPARIAQIDGVINRVKNYSNEGGSAVANGIICKVPKETRDKYGYAHTQYWDHALDMDISWRVRDCRQRVYRIRDLVRELKGL